MLSALRTLLMFAFWALLTPIGALIAFPWTFITGKVEFLYAVGTWIAITGVRLAGVRPEVIGLDRLDPRATYIFMSNHVSNLDPPLLIPLIPRRTSVLVKRELFRIPILGRAMRMASLVAVDRRNRDAAIASLRAAADVVRAGLHLTIFPEGTRSRDGRLLPFKKGPFYLAMDTGVPIVPVTILHTERLWPKGKMFVRPGTATLIFHPPIRPADCPDRDSLMNAVRDRIASALPPERR